MDQANRTHTGVAIVYTVLQYPDYNVPKKTLDLQGKKHKKQHTEMTKF